jgi:hypothetical protein
MASAMPATAANRKEYMCAMAEGGGESVDVARSFVVHAALRKAGDAHRAGMETWSGGSRDCTDAD